MAATAASGETASPVAVVCVGMAGKTEMLQFYFERAYGIEDSVCNCLQSLMTMMVVDGIWELV